MYTCAQADDVLSEYNANLFVTIIIRPGGVIANLNYSQIYTNTQKQQ